MVKEESNDLQALSEEDISNLYCSVFEKSQNIIFIAQGTRILLVNSAINNLGYTIPEVLDRNFNIFNLIVPEQRDEIQR
ncbi:MAG: PAS domain S-box protein, partial [Promethearchaeota archaeon]